MILLLYTDLTKKAMSLAFDLHLGQKDKGGLPYIFHPIAVAEMMKDEYSTCVALLHDIIEDTEFTIEQLRNLHFPDEVVDGVIAMTRMPGEVYKDYLVRVKANDIARKVKIGDLKHNMDAGRLKSIDKEYLSMLKRYTKSLEFLLEDD